MTASTGSAPVRDPAAEDPGPGAGRRVLIVVENLPVPFDRRVWSEATTLVRAGYAVSVICPVGKGYEDAYEFIDGVHVYRHPLRAEADTGLVQYVREYGSALWHELRLAHRVRRERGVDVLHGCNPPDLIFLIAWTLRPFGVRYLFDHHDICPELFETKFGKRGILWRAMVLFEWLNFRTASVSIATNESYADIARSRGGKAKDDVFVVRSGPMIDNMRLQAPKPELKKGADYLIGYVGVIGQQEGLDLLVEAAEHLTGPMGRTDVHFGIVGDGPQRQEIEDLVRARGLERFFTFTGRAPNDVLLDMLNTADVCVNPDRATPMNDLSTMNKILEYMALKKPVVQFDLREGRISAGEASLYAAKNDPVDFAGKIAALLDDAPARERMGETGYRRILDHLSWTHSIPPLLAAYERIFTKMGRAGRARTLATAPDTAAAGSD